MNQHNIYKIKIIIIEEENNDVGEETKSFKNRIKIKKYLTHTQELFKHLNFDES